VYSRGAAPRLHLLGDRWQSVVVDCSETGVRFVRAGDERRPLVIGDRVSGEIEFCNGGLVEIAGRVVRQQGNEVALHLDEQGIPFPEIIREQMYLRRHFQVLRTMEVGDPVARRNHS
jgi:hypothetical protein